MGLQDNENEYGKNIIIYIEINIIKNNVKRYFIKTSIE